MKWRVDLRMEGKKSGPAGTCVVYSLPASAVSFSKLPKKIGLPVTLSLLPSSSPPPSKLFHPLSFSSLLISP
jgi:hypothetical protein